jgi:hypothetical protein
VQERALPFPAFVKSWNEFARHYDWCTAGVVEPEIQEGSFEAQASLAADIILAWGETAMTAAKEILGTQSEQTSEDDAEPDQYTVTQQGGVKRSGNKTRTERPLDVGPAVSAGVVKNQATLVFRPQAPKNV